jgi:SAM-dependent methyltransferase
MAQARSGLAASRDKWLCAGASMCRGQGDLRVFSHWFEKKQGSDAPAAGTESSRIRLPRHSGGWAQLRQRLQTESGLRVLDTGSTSPTNINYLTGLGQSVYLADVVHDACTGNWQIGTDEDGNPVWNIEGFLEQSLKFSGRMFDVVLLWTSLDYLPEALVAPVVERLYEATNPGGQVLAFFHTRDQGEETRHCRFHVTPGDDVEMQMAEQFPIQRVFTNRSIKQLFSAWSDYRQFLAKDSVSELLITR